MDNGLEERERLLGFEGQERNDLKQRIWKEMKLTWRIAFPSILSRIASFGQILVTQSFLGHVGEIELASFALVQSIFLRFVNGILLGMSSATETLCGQAFGAGHYHMMGIYLQRSWLVDCVTATIMLPVFIFGTPIMNLLGQQKDIAETGGVISLWLIPFVYNFVFSLTIQMFLQAQLKNMIIGWLSTASFLLHVLMSWIFVSELDLGIAGAMGSLNISAWLNIIGLFVYIFCGWCPDTWKGFTSAAFTDILPVIKLSISSGVMICLELWYNSILVLLAGYMKNATVAISAFSICLNVSAFQLMIFLGFLGVAVGAGMQSTVAFVNLGSYYFVGVPTGVLLAYVANLGVTGLWIGLLGGIVIQTIILSFIIWRTDWDDQVNKASQRLNKWLLKPSEKSDRSSPNM
ncbi:protein DETOXIFICATION 25 [Citrus sinensis]|uniref:Protein DETOXIFICATION 25 n=1 Tax=Citrus sinensis TaxID=2711 RepID=A0ACB8LC20_CITSI|nr:protein DETOXIFICATION 25 [Citrus sinensis]